MHSRLQMSGCEVGYNWCKLGLVLHAMLQLIVAVANKIGVANITS
jgi:hypothetical protein